MNLPLPADGKTVRVPARRLSPHPLALEAVAARLELQTLVLARSPVQPLVAVATETGFKWFAGPGSLLRLAPGEGVTAIVYRGPHLPPDAEIRRLAWSDAMCPAGLPGGAAAARWFRLVHLRMPADLRRDLFGTDRLSLSRAEALTGISRRTLKRHLPKGGWW